MAPKEATYKLEVWGAQGGASYGGKGGYSVGTCSLNSSKLIYVVVGGMGKTGSASVEGGFNGGGASYPGIQVGITASGGGATHIASVVGTLTSLLNQRKAIYIVAGGGGGGGELVTGGTGGGLEGGNGGYATNNPDFKGLGGNQTKPGYQKGYTDNNFALGGYGSFGCGGSAFEGDYSAGGYGGGGGWYGGGGTNRAHSGGGGGSGYIGGVSNGKTENGMRTGNGLAQISWILQ